MMAKTFTPTAPEWVKQPEPQSVSRDYLSFLIQRPPDLKVLELSWRDPIIRQRGIGLIEEMLQDARVFQASQVRKAAVIALGYTIDVDEEIVKSEEVKQRIERFLEFALSQMIGTKFQAFGDILTAVDYGWSFNAITLRAVEFGEFKGMWVPAKLTPLPPGVFRVELDDDGNVTGATNEWVAGGGARLGTQLTGMNSEAFVPIDRLIYMRHGTRFGSPYGKSQIVRVFEPWWNKRIVRRMRNTALDRFGAPFVVAKVPPTAENPKRNKLLAIIRDMHIEGGAVIDNTDAIEMPTAGGLGGVQAFQATLDYEDKEIISGIAGSTLGMAEGSQGTGSYAQARVHQDTFLYGVQEDSQNLEEVLNEQLIYKLLLWNFGPDMERAAHLKWNAASEPHIDAFVARFTQLAGFNILDLTDPRELAFVRKELGYPEVPAALIQGEGGAIVDSETKKEVIPAGAIPRGQIGMPQMGAEMGGGGEPPPEGQEEYAGPDQQAPAQEATPWWETEDEEAWAPPARGGR